MRLLFTIIGLFTVLGIFAQKKERDYVRRGNRFYEDSLYVKAEIDYRKALELNPKSVEATYNLGNTLLMQQKVQDAMEKFVNASSLIGKNGKNIALDKDERLNLAKIYHNMGVILQSNQQYDLCIDAYKNALRNNPYDHETRYNLTLAQKMKKQQEQQQQEQQDQQDQQQQDQQQEEKEEQNQQKEEQKEQEQQQNQEQQSQPQNEMSKDNAEQMLKAIMQDEKEIQEKVKKAMQEVEPRKFDKDW